MLWEEPGRLGPGASCLLSRKWPTGNGVGEHVGRGYGSRCLWGTAGCVYSQRCAPVPSAQK